MKIWHVRGFCIRCLRKDKKIEKSIKKSIEEKLKEACYQAKKINLNAEDLSEIIRRLY